MSTSVVVRGNPAAVDDQQGSAIITGAATAAQATASAAVAGLLVIPVSFRTPPGLMGELTKFAQSWDPGIDGFVRYSLRINGAIPNGYNQLAVQTSSPSSDVELPTPLRLEQLSLVEVLFYANTGPIFGSGLNVFARVVAKYYNPT